MSEWIGGYDYVCQYKDNVNHLKYLNEYNQGNDITKIKINSPLILLNRNILNFNSLLGTKLIVYNTWFTI